MNPPLQISIGSKVHNAIVQAVFIAGVLNGVIPDLPATTHVPAWVSIVLAAVVKIGNEFLDDKPANPTT
jgi:hypothetical protein